MIIIQERGRDRSSHFTEGFAVFLCSGNPRDQWGSMGSRETGVAPVLGAHGFLAVLPAQDAGAWTSHRPLAFSSNGKLKHMVLHNT